MSLLYWARNDIDVKFVTKIHTIFTQLVGVNEAQKRYPRREV